MINKLKTMVDLLPQPIFEFDKNYKITFYNKSLLHILNISSIGIENINIQDYIFPISDKLENIFFNKNRLSNECVIKNDTSIYHVIMFSYPSYDDDENIIGRICTLCDTTERKTIEEKLKEKEEIYKYIVNNSHDGIILVKENGIIDFVNREFLNITGYNNFSDLIDNHFTVFVANEDIERLTNYNKKRIMGLNGEETPSKYDFKLKKKDGTLRDASIHVNIFTLPDGSIRVLGQLIDITEKKELGDKFTALHEIMQLVFDGMQDVIWAKDIHNDNIFMNKKFKDSFISNEIINNKVFDFGDDSYKNHKPIHSIEKVESEFFGTKWLDICKFPIFKNDDLIGIAGIARDITQNVINNTNIDESIKKWKEESELQNMEVKNIIKKTLNMINDAIKGDRNGAR